MKFPVTLTALATLVAAPAFADEVNVYSYRQPFLVQPLFDAFTAETGIKVNVQFLNKGMIERLQAEGDRSPADLILTVDISRLTAVVDAGVTQAVDLPVLEENIPAEFRDPAGHWFGLTSRARIVYAAKDRVAEGEIQTYEDLADPKWKGKICIRPGTNAYNLALTSAVIAHNGEEAAKSWLEGVKSNLARKPQGNDRAQVKAIWAGECDISVGNTYYMKKMLDDQEQKAWADSVRIVMPKFEEGGTHVNISGMAMTKAAPNKDNAVKMMEWLSSAEAQEIYAETNGEYPLIPGSSPSELVASWGDLNPDDLALVDIANLRGTSLRLVEEVNFDE
ncbi:MAG: Fe(3+) ABC transporter substrate-binding protein [Pseudomonadota bacterium]